MSGLTGLFSEGGRETEIEIEIEIEIRMEGIGFGEVVLVFTYGW